MDQSVYEMKQVDVTPECEANGTERYGGQVWVILYTYLLCPITEVCHNPHQKFNWPRTNN